LFEAIIEPDDRFVMKVPTKSKPISWRQQLANACALA
jgi:hypothetical protein